MTPRRVVTRSLWDGRRSFGGFAAYIVLLVAAIVSIYPSLGHNPALTKLVQSYPGTLKAFIGFGGVVDYTSGIGYLGIELFSLMLPGFVPRISPVSEARTWAQVPGGRSAPEMTLLPVKREKNRLGDDDAEASCLLTRPNRSPRVCL